MVPVDQTKDNTKKKKAKKNWGEVIRPRALQMAAAVVYSGCSRSGLYRAHAAGKLVMLKNGRQTLVTVESLDALMDSLPKAESRGSLAA